MLMGVVEVELGQYREWRKLELRVCMTLGPFGVAKTANTGDPLQFVAMDQWQCTTAVWQRQKLVLEVEINKELGYRSVPLLDRVCCRKNSQGT